MGGYRQNKLSLLNTDNFEAFCVYNADFMSFRAQILNQNLFSDFNKDIKKCVFMDQVHSNKVQIYNLDYENNKNLRLCDGLISDQKGLALCVLSADCLPLLLYHKNGFVMALHSGRMGCFDNILNQSILKAKDFCKNKFKDESFTAQDFTLIIGPSICAKHYEIAGEVLEFAKLHFKQFLQENHLDLKALIKHQALNLGIEDIKDCEICSFDDERFFSYRKNKTQKRFVSVIYLKA